MHVASSYATVDKLTLHHTKALSTEGGRPWTVQREIIDAPGWWPGGRKTMRTAAVRRDSAGPGASNYLLLVWGVTLIQGSQLHCARGGCGFFAGGRGKKKNPFREWVSDVARITQYRQTQTLLRSAIPPGQSCRLHSRLSFCLCSACQFLSTREEKVNR